MPHDTPSEPLYTVGEEIAHTVTHGVGLVLSLGALVTLVVQASLWGDAWRIAGGAVFGCALVLLYAASTLYHGVRSPKAKRVLRELDHGAIFLLIAGSYTPFALVSLRGGWGWTLLCAVWGLALVGIVLKLAMPARARRLSVPLYLLMGWMALVAFEPLVRALPPQALVLLFAGGVAYTLGVVFYAWKRLPYNHAVWHVFVLAGSICHFSCVAGYVMPLAQ